MRDSGKHNIIVVLLESGSLPRLGGIFVRGSPERADGFEWSPVSRRGGGGGVSWYAGVSLMTMMLMRASEVSTLSALDMVDRRHSCGVQPL